MNSYIKWLVVFSLLFSIGFFRTAFIFISQKDYSNDLVDKVCEYFVAVPSEKKHGNQYLQLQRETDNQEVSVVVELYPEYKYGDVVAVEGCLEPGKRAYYPNLTLLRQDGGHWFFRWVYSLRDQIKDLVGQVFSEPGASLVSGIVFGIELDLGEELNIKMRQAGLVHVVVASGYNVSIVIAFFAILTKPLSRKVSALIVLVGISIYALIAGLDPPIVRASIMGVSTVVAVTFGRQRDSLLWLVFSAMILLLINPLIFESLSFQLSYVATLGIIFFMQFWERAMFFLPGFIREETATTWAVQLFTMPLIWLRLGVVSWVSLIVNMITLWSIPLIMLFSVLSLMVGLIYIPLGRVVAIPAVICLKYILFIVELFS